MKLGLREQVKEFKTESFGREKNRALVWAEVPTVLASSHGRACVGRLLNCMAKDRISRITSP